MAIWDVSVGTAKGVCTEDVVDASEISEGFSVACGEVADEIRDDVERLLRVKLSELEPEVGAELSGLESDEVVAVPETVVRSEGTLLV